MDYELDTPSTSDMISAGNLTLNSQQFSDFHFMWSTSFAPGIYPLIGFASSSCSLAANTSGTIDGYPATLAVQGSDLVVNVVPEPSTAALLATGVLGLIGCMWRRRSRRLRPAWACVQKFIHTASVICRFVLPPAALLSMTKSWRFQPVNAWSYNEFG